MSHSSQSPNGNGTSDVKTTDETTPLLAASVTTPILGAAEAEQIQQSEVNKNDQIPTLQVFVLSYASLVEPVAFFSIFPYINAMIEKVGGVEKEDVGFYSGLIESLFSATQMCVMVLWGKASDRYGRKPILVISLFGIAFTTALFGLSTAIWQMILFRCLAGVFAGTVVTVRTMLSENSSPKTQATVFSRFAFARNIGILIGPVIGGALERPAEKFPSLFGRIQFFKEYPYAFPSFISALVGLTAAISAAIIIKETLDVQALKDASKNRMSIFDLIKYPGVRQVLLVYNYVMLLAITFTTIFPVFMYTPIPLGGLSLTPGWIAMFMSLGGLSQSLWILLVFPRLHKRIGTEGILTFSATIWPIFFILHPTCNLFLRYDLKALFWTVFPVNNAVGCGCAMSFAAVQLAINDIAPSPETFGTLNSIALALASGLRAVAPALSTSLYATGVKYHILGGHMFWVILVAIALGLPFFIRMLPEKTRRKVMKSDDEQEEQA
ncbi:MFS general substrate transporter [Periconia macrospinosa]|uniref:MFS general substrate transporter n=1 Tax=Periconia macrospinosa TaxID=97972 RepID=A0A2V1E026_9PLEO|nr:MFS general substrate transporter [Periconia macrospinosa]